MIWFYERGAETLRIETRFNPASRFYELVWHRANGTRTVETFSSEAMFRQRTEAIERTLAGLEWVMAGYVQPPRPSGSRASTAGAIAPACR